MSIKYLNWAWRQNLKTPLQKLVLLKLGDNADDEGRAFPSIDLMAKFTCSNEKTVRNNIKHLESFGLITVFKQPARGGHLRNEYMLHLEVKLNYKDEEEESITTPEEPSSGSSAESVTGSKRNLLPDNHQSNHQIINHKKDIDRFDEFWDMYGKKTGLDKCKAKFKKLTKAEIDAVFDNLPSYIQSTPDKQFRKHPYTWLNGKCWNDEIIASNQQQTTDDINNDTSWIREMK